MRRLCFGGSFNPIHHGHLICARSVAEAMGFDRVVLIPSANPPHKLDFDAIAPAEHRLRMCRLAVQNDPFFEVDDIELTRAGPSFTIDTARALRQRGWSEVHWLIGADLLATLPEWHEPVALLREVQFVVMARPDHPLDWTKVAPELRFLERQVIQAPLIDISATQIRRRAALRLPINYLTPPTVAQYIHDNGLYQA